MNLSYREALRQFITLPHFEMPPQTLTRAEIDDVIAYILSRAPAFTSARPSGASAMPADVAV